MGDSSVILLWFNAKNATSKNLQFREKKNVQFLLSLPGAELNI